VYKYAVEKPFDTRPIVGREISTVVRPYLATMADDFVVGLADGGEQSEIGRRRGSKIPNGLAAHVVHDVVSGCPGVNRSFRFVPLFIANNESFNVTATIDFQREPAWSRFDDIAFSNVLRYS